MSTSMSTPVNAGLLLVMMEPPPALAEEFHDWYDTEHLPERLAVPGIRTATRWVCLHGWPRFLALYDLDSPAVMDSPAYLAVSGANFSPWSRRLLPRMIGRRRVVAQQLAPGDAEGLPQDRVACLVVARTPHPPAAAPALPGLLQRRVFRSVDASADAWTLLALDRVATAEQVHAALADQGATLLNLAVPYLRASG
jgi:hypothetical protein